MEQMMRPTSKVRLTLDAKPVERDQWQDLADQERRLIVERERAETSKRGPATKRLNALRAQMDDVAAVIRDGQVEVTVQGLSRGQYRDLLKNHPPRDGDELDERYGYNGDTFPGALLRAATISAATLNGDTVELDLDAWIDDDGPLNEAEFLAWLTAAISLNTRVVGQSPPLRAS